MCVVVWAFMLDCSFLPTTYNALRCFACTLYIVLSTPVLRSAPLRRRFLSDLCVLARYLTRP